MCTYVFITTFVRPVVCGLVNFYNSVYIQLIKHRWYPVDQDWLIRKAKPSEKTRHKSLTGRKKQVNKLITLFYPEHKLLVDYFFANKFVDNNQ